jgi:hypothetical protein
MPLTCLKVVESPLLGKRWNMQMGLAILSDASHVFKGCGIPLAREEMENANCSAECRTVVGMLIDM